MKTRYIKFQAVNTYLASKTSWEENLRDFLQANLQNCHKKFKKIEYRIRAYG